MLLRNHSIGFSCASSLTLVGAMRASIGPAIRVRLAGWIPEWSCAMTADAASAETVGWQTATT